MHGIKGIGGFGVVGDIDDAYGDIIVIEVADMIVTSSYQIASRYTLLDGTRKWVIKRIGLNAAGETIYIKTYDQQDLPPTFVTGPGIPI